MQAAGSGGAGGLDFGITLQLKRMDEKNGCLKRLGSILTNIYMSMFSPYVSIKTNNHTTCLLCLLM